MQASSLRVSSLGSAAYFLYVNLAPGIVEWMQTEPNISAVRISVCKKILPFPCLLIAACIVLTAHSWFATVVDGNELGPVYPFN